MTIPLPEGWEIRKGRVYASKGCKEFCDECKIDHACNSLQDFINITGIKNPRTSIGTHPSSYSAIVYQDRIITREEYLEIKSKS